MNVPQDLRGGHRPGSIGEWAMGSCMAKIWPHLRYSQAGQACRHGRPALSVCKSWCVKCMVKSRFKFAWEPRRDNSIETLSTHMMHYQRIPCTCNSFEVVIDMYTSEAMIMSSRRVERRLTQFGRVTHTFSPHTNPTLCEISIDTSNLTSSYSPTNQTGCLTGQKYSGL